MLIKTLFDRSTRYLNDAISSEIL